MKTVLWPLLLVCFCTNNFAQTFTLNRGGATAANYYEEIPYELINGKLFVYVTFAGKQHRFVFDTGAPVALSKELADQTGLNVVQKSTFKDAFGGFDSVAIVRIDGLRLGQLQFDSIPALRGVPGFYKCWEADGVIGSNLLRRSIVRIIPDRHVIVLTDQEGKLRLDKNAGMPMITTIGDQSDPKIRVRFDDKTDLLLGFDTGEGNFLRLSENDMRSLKKAGVGKVLFSGYGAHNFGQAGMEKNADKYLLQTATFVVGGTEFHDAVVEINKNAIPGIGAGLLKYGTVTLDFLHGLFYFESTHKTYDLDDKQWPFQPALAGDKLVVGVVWDKKSSGIKPGQQIMAIDDISVEHIEFCDMIRRPSLLAGKETAVITVRDEQGRLSRIEIHKE